MKAEFTPFLRHHVLRGTLYANRQTGKGRFRERVWPVFCATKLVRIPKRFKREIAQVRFAKAAFWRRVVAAPSYDGEAE
jgi:hypothetical protein